jgi:hypothetical protein
MTLRSPHLRNAFSAQVDGLTDQLITACANNPLAHRLARFATDRLRAEVGSEMENYWKATVLAEDIFESWRKSPEAPKAAEQLFFADLLFIFAGALQGLYSTYALFQDAVDDKPASPKSGNA